MPYLRPVLSCMIFTVAHAVCAQVVAEPFSPRASHTDHRPSFIRLTPTESGFTESNSYRDPRAWTERYLAATGGSVGTGLGVADFNGDGWPDVFVAMREGQSRLYLNVNGERFIDHTKEAGILENRDWATGVTVVDINGDHLPDIYVCYFNAPNRLYVNQGRATFTEEAVAYGVAVRDASNAAFFADYNRDGRLDLFLQTNIIDSRHGTGGQPDYLFRNDGARSFTNITSQSGIRSGPFGGTQGHSALWMDFDDDGWEDLYVANDFSTHDYLYRNRGDGSFEEVAARLPAVPFSSMGSDVGDVNNDGLVDVVTTDMATISYAQHAVSMATNARKTYALSPGAQPPMLMKNGLLLNRGIGQFIDVAYAWNLAATDWTWSVRLADLDNDGWQDAFFTNGMTRQFHNADLSYRQDSLESVAAKNVVFRDSPVLREHNLLFRNSDGMGFVAANDTWQFSHLGVSFGAVVFDFNRDGALDLLYANYEEPPTLWRNDLPVGNAVQIRLVGASPNTEAIGAVVVAFFSGRRQAQKVLSNRGYLSSDEKVLHFGLGTAAQIDRLQIHWPDGTQQEVSDLPSGARYVVQQDSASHDRVKTATRPPRSSRFLAGPPRAAQNPRASQAHPDPPDPLSPFKVIPNTRTRELRADFAATGEPRTLVLRPWDSPQLLRATAAGPVDESLLWGLSEISGLYERALVADLNRDGYPDVVLGGLGLNHEISFRGEGDGQIVQYLGQFQSGGPTFHLNAYNWDGVLRLYDSMIDLSKVHGRVPSFFRSFREFAELDVTEFIARTRFSVQSTRSITHFRSAVLINTAGRGFRFIPLPQEAQYGRVWDLATGDLDGDGIDDLILLLAQVSPHARSPQAESSFVSIFLGRGDGTFVGDDQPAFDHLPTGLITGISWRGGDGGGGSELVLELAGDIDISCRPRR